MVHISSGQTFSNPQSIVYDAKYKRYLVGDAGSGKILSVVPGSAPTTFATGVSQCSGLCIVGDTVYVCVGRYLKGYSIHSGSMVLNKDFVYSPLIGICTDGKGNLFLTNSTLLKIIRYNIASQSYNNFQTLTYTPQGIVYDTNQDRLVIASLGSVGRLWGVSLIDSSKSIIQDTYITDLRGLTVDRRGRLYATAYTASGGGVYMFDSTYSAPPTQLLTYPSNYNPAFLFSNHETDTLAVPCAGINQIKYYGFPYPRSNDDFEAVVVSVPKQICVTNNDSISGANSLLLRSFSTPLKGIAVANGNCIDYTPQTLGIDTIFYQVCKDDTIDFCSTSTLYIFVLDSNGNHEPIAYSDEVTTLQLVSATYNVVANDLEADGDSLCISSIYGSDAFILDTTDCRNIVFQPDSFFIGSDTCLYTVCDNGIPVLCDTAFFIVSVLRNDSLLPHAQFYVDFSNWTCYSVTAINQSVRSSETPVWRFTPSFGYPPMTLYGDTGYYLNLSMHGFMGEICLFVSNPFGSDSICYDYDLLCEGFDKYKIVYDAILHPNPASTTITLTGTEAGSTATITNLHGQVHLQKVVNGERQTIDIESLPAGFYFCTLQNGQRRQVLRFMRE